MAETQLETKARLDKLKEQIDNDQFEVKSAFNKFMAKYGNKAKGVTIIANENGVLSLVNIIMDGAIFE